jgi:hypothetical protein
MVGHVERKLASSGGQLNSAPYKIEMDIPKNIYIYLRARPRTAKPILESGAGALYN